MSAYVYCPAAAHWEPFKDFSVQFVHVEAGCCCRRVDLAGHGGLAVDYDAQVPEGVGWDGCGSSVVRSPGRGPFRGVLAKK